MNVVATTITVVYSVGVHVGVNDVVDGGCEGVFTVFELSGVGFVDRCVKVVKVFWL